MMILMKLSSSPIMATGTILLSDFGFGSGSTSGMSRKAITLIAPSSEISTATPTIVASESSGVGNGSECK